MIYDKGPMNSNLDCFLHYTTLMVQSQFLPKKEFGSLNRLWYPWDREKGEYFTWANLWNCYHEWSTCGTRVPIVLNNRDTVVQYYVPYLSAIQIFTSTPSINSLREEIEAGECEMRDSFSDSCSYEGDSDKLWRWDESSSEDGGLEQESLFPLNDRLGYIYFKYFETSTPYGRVPLMDKIGGLAQRYPGLFSLRSADLSLASWMAVAWYPIYHIPMGRTIKDLSTCFLAYHTLSSSFLDMGVEVEPEDRSQSISLPPFGLPTYKMQGRVLISSHGGQDQERLVSFQSAVDSWLKQLGVQHHGFSYFTGVRRE